MHTAPDQRQPASPVLIGAAAIEDESILTAVVRLNETGLSEVVASPEPIPVAGYGATGIASVIASAFGDHARQLRCLAISSPGTVDTLAGTVIDVPRQDWRAGRKTGSGAAKPLVDFAAEFRKLRFPVRSVLVDNDTATGAMGEWLLQEQGLERDPGDFAYIRAGTGVNATMLIDGKPLRGLLAPEMGHIVVRPDPADRFRGTCMAHQDCLEGLTGLPAIRQRLEALRPDERPRDRWRDLVSDPGHEIWDFIAGYLAQLCVALTVCFAPPRIVLGGLLPVIAPELLTKVRERLPLLLKGYPRHAPIVNKQYVQEAVGREQSSLIGALAAAQAFAHHAH